jgi:hypothetical protein
MLLARSIAQSILSWLKLPSGASLAGVASGGPTSDSLPKRSRLFTLGVFAMTVVLLLLPQSREAIRTVHGSGNAYQTSSSDRRTLDKLAARAEKQNDAATLAFVALSVDNPERFATLADRAVSVNPEFVWIYGTRRRWPGGVYHWPEQLKRLQADDLANAVPKLFVAESMEKPNPEALWKHRPPEDKEIEKMLANCPQWAALMQQAFASPQYNSYFQRHFELAKCAWNRERSLSPSVILNGLWAHDIPNLLDIRVFSNIRIHEAGEAVGEAM